MSFKFEKLKAAIHYICEKATRGEQDQFDHIKLNKVLWYSDVYAYLTQGQSITGSAYIRKPFGPVAKHNRAAISVLEQEGKLKHGKMQPQGRNTFWKDCYDVLEEASKEPFSGAELKIIDDVFKRVLQEHSMAISAQTHGEVWELASENEEIPLYTVFAEQVAKPTTEQLKLASAGLALRPA
jgi:hypothetical protein